MPQPSVLRGLKKFSWQTYLPQTRGGATVDCAAACSKGSEPMADDSADDSYFWRITQRAMGTDFEVLLPRCSSPAAMDAAVSALDSLEEIERQLTVYSPHSELSLLNRRGATGPVRTSAMLWEILLAADRVWRETAGAFDISAGPLVEAWGFTQRSGRRPSEAEIEAARWRTGWQHVRLDHGSRTVEFLREGMSLNLGGIGKGYALDRLAAKLGDAGVADFLLHGGNSSVLARGNDQQAGTNGGWKIGLQHPTRKGRRIAGITLKDQALATSGSGNQFFHFRGERFGHVIDPRTGFPAGEHLSLSLIGRCAMYADAFATGLFVAGREALEHYARSHPDEGIVAVEASGRQGEVRVVSWNLSDEVFADLDAGASRDGGAF